MYMYVGICVYVMRATRPRRTHTQRRLCFAVEICVVLRKRILEAVDSADVRCRHVDGAGAVMERESSRFCSARFRNNMRRVVAMSLVARRSPRLDNEVQTTLIHLMYKTSISKLSQL